MKLFVQIMSSKEMSLLCFVFNIIMAFGAFVAGDLGWLIFSLALGTLCLHNYYVKLDQEND